MPGEVIEAKVTVLGEGSLGLLAEEAVERLNLGKGRNPQIYSVGVKEIVRLPEKNNFGAHRILHTMGFPKKALIPDVFGGGKTSIYLNTKSLSNISQPVNHLTD